MTSDSNVIIDFVNSVFMRHPIVQDRFKSEVVLNFDHTVITGQNDRYNDHLSELGDHIL